MVDRQAMTHGFFSVVLALYQFVTGDVVFAGNFRRVVDDVVNAAAGLVNTATGDALNDLFVFNGDFNHRVQLDTGSHQCFSLRNGAREAVEQEAVGAIRLSDAVLNQCDDQVIRHQAAGIHDALGLNAQRSTGLDRCTQHVASGNLWNAEFLGDELSLSTFTGPGSSQQNDAH